MNNPSELSPDQIKELTSICQENGKDVKDFLIYTIEDARKGFRNPEDGTIAISIIGEDGKTLSGNNLANLLFYELTSHNVGNTEPDEYASNMGEHGEGTVGWFNKLTGNIFGQEKIDAEEYEKKYGPTLEQNNDYVSQIPWTETENWLQWKGVIDGELSMDEALAIHDLVHPLYNLIADAQITQISVVGGSVVTKLAKDNIVIKTSKDKNININDNPLDNTHYTNKVNNQMKSGDYHSFPKEVDSFAGSGQKLQLLAETKYREQKLH